MPDLSDLMVPNFDDDGNPFGADKQGRYRTGVSGRTLVPNGNIYPIGMLTPIARRAALDNALEARAGASPRRRQPTAIEMRQNGTTIMHMPPPGPGEDPSEIYTVGGRARLENYQKVRRQLDTARNAPPPKSSLPISVRLGLVPNEGSITYTDQSGQTKTIKTAGGADTAPQVQQMRNNYIQDHQDLANALKPQYLSDMEEQQAQSQLGNEARGLQNQAMHEQIDRYHQATPAIIDRLSNSSDWTPEDRKQLLDTLRTYHDFNTALLRQADEARKQTQGDRAGDQKDTALGQNQNKITNQQNQFEVTAGQRNRGLDIRQQGVNQQGAAIQNRQNRPRTGMGALIDLLRGRGPSNQPPSPTTQSSNYSTLLPDTPGSQRGLPPEQIDQLQRTLVPGGGFTTPGRNMLDSMLPRPTSPEEADRLQPGSWFIDPTGQKRQVPIRQATPL